MRTFCGLCLFFLLVFPACNTDQVSQKESKSDQAKSEMLSTIVSESDPLSKDTSMLDTIAKQVALEVEEKNEEKNKEEKEKKKKKRERKRAKIDFQETVFDFGVIKQGTQIKHNFVFKNTGKADLEILNVEVTCGCTVPSFPFIPIAPGEEGTIGITYNSTGKLGNQRPMITVIANTKPARHKVYLKGIVDAERAAEKEIKED